MMDPDYMRGNQDKPFAPPTENSGISTLQSVFVFVLVLFALFRFSEWALDQRALTRKIKPPAQPTRTATSTPPTASPGFPPSVDAHGSQLKPTPQGGTQTITKCVLNGKTSYGDGPCLNGATVSQVAIRSNHNLMDAVKTQVTSQEEPGSAESNITQTAQNDPSARKSQCAALDKLIEALDAQARQPLDVQSHDRIKARRKAARDEQARIPCR